MRLINILLKYYLKNHCQKEKGDYQSSSLLRGDKATHELLSEGKKKKTTTRKGPRMLPNLEGEIDANTSINHLLHPTSR